MAETNRTLPNSRRNKARPDLLADQGGSAKIRGEAVDNAAAGLGAARQGTDSSGGAISNASGLSQAEISEAKRIVEQGA